MATITGLAAASALDGTEVTVVVQGATDKKATTASLAAAAAPKAHAASHAAGGGDPVTIAPSQINAAIPVSGGGTGQTTKTNAFDALSPGTTKGDLIAYNGADNVRVGIGTDGQVLTAASAQAAGVAWATVSSSGGVPTSRLVATGGSLTGGGDLTADRTLSLVNDMASPGANQLYATNGLGVKGWVPQALASSFNQTTAWTGTGTGATARSDQARFEDMVVDVCAFGADPTGVANSRTAIGNALTAAHNKILFFPPGTYNLGNTTTETIYQINASVRPRLISGFGATLQTTCTITTGNTGCIVFQIASCSDVVFEGLTCLDTAGDPMADSGNGLGQHAFYLTHFTADTTRITFRNCNVFNGRAGVLTDFQANSFTIRDLYIEDCHFDNLLYATAYNDRGDHVVGRYSTRACRRSYFPHGVSHHDIDIDIKDANSASASALIKSYTIPTTDIRLRVKYRGTRQGPQITPSVVLAMAGTDGSWTGAINNISIDMDDSVDSAAAVSVAFEMRDASDATQTSSTKQMGRVRIAGNHGPLPTFEGQYVNEWAVELAPNIYEKWLAGVNDTRGMSLATMGRRTKIFLGSMATARTINLKYGLADGLYSWRLRAHAIANYTAPSSAASQGVAEWQILGGIGSGFAVPFVWSASPISQQSMNTAPVFVVTDPGDGVNVAVSCSTAAYQTSNSKLILTLSY